MSQSRRRGSVEQSLALQNFCDEGRETVPSAEDLDSAQGTSSCTPAFESDESSPCGVALGRCSGYGALGARAKVKSIGCDNLVPPCRTRPVSTVDEPSRKNKRYTI